MSEPRPLTSGRTLVTLTLAAQPMNRRDLLTRLRKPSQTRAFASVWLNRRLTELIAEGYVDEAHDLFFVTRAGEAAIEAWKARKAAEAAGEVEILQPERDLHA